MTIAEVCVKRPIFAMMLIGFLLVLGIFSFRDLGVDLFPRADPATVNVVVQLPGALPEEISTQVVLPLEDHEVTFQDGVTYYAFAEDNHPDKPQRITTELQWIDIRPYKRTYQILDTGGT